MATPSYCIKGANWIPADAVAQPRHPRRCTARLVVDSAAVHMNMLRVWGGGIYEDPDDFYELCDEHGILRLAGLHVSPAATYPTWRTRPT